MSKNKVREAYVEAIESAGLEVRSEELTKKAHTKYRVGLPGRKATRIIVGSCSPSDAARTFKNAASLAKRYAAELENEK